MKLVLLWQQNETEQDKILKYLAAITKNVSALIQRFNKLTQYETLRISLKGTMINAWR